jgi:RNA polymerase sigma factor (sigma-70 family)
LHDGVLAGAFGDPMTEPGRMELEDRFVALVEEHKKILYKVANSYCRPAEDRSDLVQEILVQLWRSFPRFDDRHRFSTWMYRIAMNTAISFYRSDRHRRRRTLPLEDSAFEIAAPTMPPEDENIRELYRFIHAELDALNKALVILYLDGHSHDTIAEILGISATNVGTRVGRIKQRLKQHFDRMQPDR